MSLCNIFGSTSCFHEVSLGVCKYPREVSIKSAAYQFLTDAIAHEFAVERHIYEALGEHPHIATYYGWQDGPNVSRGLLLAKANPGSLQKYLDAEHGIPTATRKKWCRQVIEVIAYIHSRGVIHSDLRPDNFLLHATSDSTSDSTSLDIWLCDFGGSSCQRLNLDGKHLPDSGFFDPNSKWVSTETTDIFSVGSVLYAILTGHWPHRNPGPIETAEEWDRYREKVDRLFKEGDFPDTDGLVDGGIVLGCWTKKYTDANQALHAWDLVMKEENDYII